MKLWKKLLLVVLVVVLIVAIGFAIYFGSCKRKISMIRDLSKKQEKVLEQDNYYQKIAKTENNTNIVIEHYQKGKKSITFFTSNNSKEIMLCDDNGQTKLYRENGKEAIEGTGPFTMLPVNINFSNSSDEEISDSIKKSNISIKEGTYNGKDCYIYTEKDIPETYFDKETGLVLKYFGADYEFEFNNVDDKIFEPDLSGYTLIE